MTSFIVSQTIMMFVMVGYNLLFQKPIIPKPIGSKAHRDKSPLDHPFYSSFLQALLLILIPFLFLVPHFFTIFFRHLFSSFSCFPLFYSFFFHNMAYIFCIRNIPSSFSLIQFLLPSSFSFFPPHFRPSSSFRSSLAIRAVHVLYRGLGRLK